MKLDVTAYHMLESQAERDWELVKFHLDRYIGSWWDDTEFKNPEGFIQFAVKIREMIKEYEK